jgi:hypothetical protein
MARLRRFYEHCGALIGEGMVLSWPTEEAPTLLR